GGLIHLTCKEMFYREANERDAAGWWLMACKPEKLDRSHPLLHWLGPGTYFLFTDLNYDRLTRRPNWFFYQSTGRLLEVLDEEQQCPRRNESIALVHRRLTRPLTDF